jgi:hypothetical protein
MFFQALADKALGSLCRIRILLWINILHLADPVGIDVRNILLGIIEYHKVINNLNWLCLLMCFGELFFIFYFFLLFEKKCCDLK